MAHFTGATTTGIFQSAGATAPAFAVGIEADDTAFGAVTLQAGVTTGVAGLAGRQGASGFTGMAD